MLLAHANVVKRKESKQTKKVNYYEVIFFSFLVCMVVILIRAPIFSTFSFFFFSAEKGWMLQELKTNGMNQKPTQYTELSRKNSQQLSNQQGLGGGPSSWVPGQENSRKEIEALSSTGRVRTKNMRSSEASTLGTSLHANHVMSTHRSNVESDGDSTGAFEALAQTRGSQRPVCQLLQEWKEQRNLIKYQLAPKIFPLSAKQQLTHGEPLIIKASPSPSGGIPASTGKLPKEDDPSFLRSWARLPSASRRRPLILVSPKDLEEIDESAIALDLESIEKGIATKSCTALDEPTTLDGWARDEEEGGGTRQNKLLLSFRNNRQTAETPSGSRRSLPDTPRVDSRISVLKSDGISKVGACLSGDDVEVVRTSTCPPSPQKAVSILESLPRPSSSHSIRPPIMVYNQEEVSPEMDGESGDALRPPIGSPMHPYSVEEVLSTQPELLDCLYYGAQDIQPPDMFGARLRSADRLLHQLSAEISRLFRNISNVGQPLRLDHRMDETKVAAACVARNLDYLDAEFLPVLSHITSLEELKECDAIYPVWPTFSEELEELEANIVYGSTTRLEQEEKECTREKRLLRQRYKETLSQLHQLPKSAALLSLPARHVHRFLFSSHKMSTSFVLFGEGERSIRPYGFQKQEGPLRNEEMMAGLASLSETPQSIRTIFSSSTPEAEESGIFLVWVCPKGFWELVPVDSFLFVCAARQQGSTKVERSLLGCTAGSSLWPSVCEKVLAKLCGSYSKTSLLSALRCVGCFTGGPTERWVWWKDDISAAFEEIQAALYTNSRGTGMILMQTATDLEKKDSCLSEEVSTARAAFLASGLLPGRTYRVLAAERKREWKKGNEEQPALLFRLWHKDDQPTSPFYSTGKQLPCGTPHAWLPMDVVQQCFVSCQACFDCRRFHDVRIPVLFSCFSGGLGLTCAPSQYGKAVLFAPLQMIRVRILACEPETRDPSARLWIGLHQAVSGIHFSQGEKSFPSPLHTPSSLLDESSGLQLSLVGARSLASTSDWLNDAQKAPPPRFHVMGESYGGRYRYIPAVWMYLDLERPYASLSDCDEENTVANGQEFMEFYIIPHIIRRMETEPAMKNISKSSVNESAGLFTSAVSLLSPTRAGLEVSVVCTPPEMAAALTLHQLERLDYDSCVEVQSQKGRKRELRDSPASAKNSARMQVNGVWKETFIW